MPDGSNWIVKKEKIMPKYDYECPGEEIIIEYTLPIVHENPTCETCEAVMRQVYQATPAIFKGTGWGAKP
jgi:predicted nucleic acid-binding Zn ribbon protein